MVEERTEELIMNSNNKRIEPSTKK